MTDVPSRAGPEPGAGARIEVLDVLRGLALLGMYVVHFNYYEATPPDQTQSHPIAGAVANVIGLFFEERFYAIFGMLFGVGFAVQLARADARGERFVARYLRRLFALAVFGFIAEGVFGYNVLFGYAMWGIPLLLVRRWSIRALIVLALLCAASVPLYNLARIAVYSRRTDGMAQVQAANEARLARFVAARTAKDQAEASDDWGTVVAARTQFMPTFHRQWSLLPSGSFTLFLLGVIAFRLGLFHRPEEHRRLIVALMIGGAASWAIARWGVPFGGPLSPAPSPDRPVSDAVVTMARANGFRIIREQWLAFTYIGVVLLLVARDRAWLQRLGALGWAGRMALTNYMMQVILLDVLFTPHGAGLKVPAIMVPVGALLLLTLQAWMSRWWLARYRLGPLEWLWRSFTRWRREPLRIAPLPSIAVAPSS
jgi:uncharacterized protein